MTPLLTFIAGLLAGVVITWFLTRKHSSVTTVDSQQLIDLEMKQAVARQQLTDARTQYEALSAELTRARDQVTALTSDNARLTAENKSVLERLDAHLKEVENLRNQMREQFQTIASEVVFKNAQRIQEEHHDKLKDILSPLQEKIGTFESQVQKSHEERIREHQSLREQLTQLHTLNTSIGEEAKNLVTALKGQTKTQGNWGEMILEKVLERSGLVKGREYEVQSSMTDQDGRRLQPDVIIHLPEGRDLVVDSKVSLIAYERYSSSPDDVSREAALKEHIASLRRHVKDLSSKNYQNLYQINTLDFVLLFVPIEPAFTAAVEQDPELFQDAFDRNIVIVSTSTLLATLRTIASIWRLENQNKNAVEIARQAGDLYDKFVSHLDDLVDIGKRIKDADKAYEASMNKLHTGRGNLISRVEKLKELGVKASKQISPKILERTQDLESEPATPNQQSS